MTDETKLYPCVKFLKTHPKAQIPKLATAGSAGMDLRTVERFTLLPGERRLIDTGLRIKIPEGYEGQIRPRSGLAFKKGLTVLNSPGTIDSDYTGPLKVLLYNAGEDEVTFCCPDRIAQIVFARTQTVTCQEVHVEEDLGDTDRGSAGFGSTGV